MLISPNSRSLLGGPITLQKTQRPPNCSCKAYLLKLFETVSVHPLSVGITSAN
jgi:hypothetical protein